VSPCLTDSQLPLKTCICELWLRTVLGVAIIPPLYNSIDEKKYNGGRVALKSLLKKRNGWNFTGTSARGSEDRVQGQRSAASLAPKSGRDRLVKFRPTLLARTVF